MLGLACALLAACAPTEADDNVPDVEHDDGSPADADAPRPEAETEDAPRVEGSEDGGFDGELGPEDTVVDDGEPDESADDDAGTDESSVDDARTDDGAIDDAGADEAAVDDARADEASVDDGRADEAAVDDARADEASVDDGRTDEASVDDGRTDDGAIDDAGADEAAADDAATPPYRHTIAVDGDPADWDDADEGFALTTASTAGHPHRAWVTWDDTYLFVAWRADAVAELDDTKWLQLYIDLDPPEPGSPTGATAGVTYRTQHPAMPTGFGAEVHIRWSGRAAGDYFSRMQYGGAGWSDVATPSLAVVDSGTFVELRVAWSDLYYPSRIGLVGFMLDEQDLGEWTWAGLYADNFVDGYFATIPLSRWLLIDRDDFLPPNDPSHRRP